jgi:hypothetical protein
MLVTNSEMVLFVWGSVMTILWQRALFDAKEFKRFTVYRLQEVANGRAKVIDTGESIEIKPNKE